MQLARPYKIDGLLEAVVERLHESLDGRNAAAIFNAAAMGAAASTIPIRTASLGGLEALTLNGGRGGPSLRVDTDVANGRSTRSTIRPGTGEETDDEVPDSAATEDSLSESEASLSARSFSGRAEKDREVWNGALSSVVGLQKRGLRGLMEGRRMRERGRSDGLEGQRVGLGIA
ncbi:galactose oxidase [Teratosphaeria destructans]|uniref:Galactose oxidase n=1 Tax=Teratosphaeria destructans TaxID=418781 RepID=A0A9W7SMF0_9PEZI|nr:galactose oxidase [Teratosphaeria destructans]